MQDQTEIRNQQRTLWNGPAANAWIDARDVLDQAFLPFEDVLADAIAPLDGKRVLDIGCGTGGTTLALARRSGPEGRVLGLDISAPMIAVARARAEEEGSTAEFIAADAEDHPFGPAEFDALVSRFGVMFFADPVRAFANLRKAARRGAALACLAWRSAAENPFMTAGERAAAPLLPDLPPRRTDGPGQFAWADEGKVRHILADAGWSAISLEPLNVPCRFPAAALDLYVTRLGPVGMALRDADESLKAKVGSAVRAAFAPYEDGETVRFNAACWLIRAEAG